ncbi:ATP synthase F1, gamma subunit, putative [Cryptosporidium muris RN66]|uniref:ATP synthase subunit gamma n=1 Tax=Cryptosporidium muris (strain RN66) TaxID=441375 RepID=B6ACX8_CRYMR|nr:ATP synthase F1, gamma subunit, putative [Cryptosporidium muris RN66]EEA05982.1 ATP synthase F1, gamma subunit, putative [Cryptosporidium muris RN66]|eukprot:XP_002140331.1 ATP synthase F1, gamma subunit [Cryptosporidium muris RN66]
MSMNRNTRKLLFCLPKHFKLCRSWQINNVLYLSTANEKIIKTRMKSIESIQKMTNAMKVVARSKLKSDQRRFEPSLHFTTTLKSLFKDIFPAIELNNKGGEDGIVYILLPLTSDKGLCGGCNSALANLTKLKINELESQGYKVLICGVGEKIGNILQRNYSSRFIHMFSGIGKDSLNYSMATVISQKILNEMLKYSNCKLALLYNQVRSAIAFDIVFEPLITPKDIQESINSSWDLDKNYELEPQKSELLPDFYEIYLVASIFGAMLNGNIAEKSSRVFAMDNACKNAEEMISSLTILHNKSRQSRITMELIEIISGTNT